MTEPRPSVLLVDDHEPNLLALAAILEPLQLDLVMVTSGSAALIRLLQGDFALILMDVQMPGMDGFATAALIKGREKSRHIPIIFLTAINREGAFQGYAHGAVDYLLKPFEPEILRSKVAVFVDLYVQRQVIQRQERELRQRDREALERKREARFRELTDALPGLVLAVRPGGEVYYANRAWHDLLGADLPTDVRELPAVHPDDVAASRARWAEAFREGTAFEWQFRLRHGDAWRWFLGRAVPQRDDAGDVVGWLAIGTDIDDRKRAEVVLEFAARASARLAGSLSTDATVEAAADLLVPELAAACVVRTAGATAVRHRAGPEAAAELAAALGGPAPGDLPEAIRGAAARRGLGAEILRPLRSDGTTVGWLWAGRPVDRPFATDEVLAIEDLARRASVAVDKAQLYAIAEHERARAEEANSVKDQFLAMISHELRTPLTAVLGWARMLLDNQLPPEMQGRALETILRSVKTQAHLIEDLLDVSRITSGKLRIDLAEVDPAAVVEAAVDVVQPMADARGVVLDVAIDRTVGPILADAQRLQQVAWNLMTNAVKFSTKGGRVRVRLGPEGDRVLLVVEDEGAGIPPAFLPHVFERFSQARSDARAAGGLGLGLAISKTLVELHGGTITAHSDGEGRGARFEVRLAARRA